MLKQTASAIASFSVPLESVGKTVSMLLFIADNGGGYAGARLKNADGSPDDLIRSSDKHFRPADPQIGPDGALWFPRAQRGEEFALRAVARDSANRWAAL
jgi:hypothetical protein